MKRIAFATLGCKSNQYDTECLKEACRHAGCEVVEFDEPAGVYVINTCTVTALADAQGRQLIRRARRRSPQALIVAVGCSVQNDEQMYRAMPEVDAVLGVRCADALLSLLERRIPLEQRALTPDTPPAKYRRGGVRSAALLERDLPTLQARARALLKIQDGCDRRCAYCAVWRARGPAFSVAVDEVVQGYRALSSYPEVVLTGIHVGRYGEGLEPSTSLCDLIERLLGEPDGPRIRLSSLDPDEFDERLIEQMSSARLCRHIHLSVQSGSAAVLHAMGRRYGPRDVRRAVRALAGNVRGISIGADFIAGFPGEREEDHAETVRLIEELPFSYLHVFPFSPRPNTEAASMSDQVHPAVKKKRTGELIRLGRGKRRAFVAMQEGSTADAVVISRRPDRGGLIRAVTDNYITVRGPARDDLYKQLISVRICGVRGEEVHALWE